MMPRNGYRFSAKIVLLKKCGALTHRRDVTAPNRPDERYPPVGFAQLEMGSKRQARDPVPAVPRRNRLDLEVLGRGLAAIGDLFVFHRLALIESGQSGLLNS